MDDFCIFYIRFHVFLFKTFYELFNDLSLKIKFYYPMKSFKFVDHLITIFIGCIIYRLVAKSYIAIINVKIICLIYCFIYRGIPSINV